MQSVLGHDVPHESINWRGRPEAIRRLIELALAVTSKSIESARNRLFVAMPNYKTNPIWSGCD
jgi:hypothetical protein